MGIFDIFRKKKVENVVPSVPLNVYYNGDNRFVFPDDKSKIILFFKKQILNEKFQNLYLCRLSYSQLGGPSLIDMMAEENLIGFEDVIVQLDLDRMKSSSDYSKKVFTKLLNYKRIKELHDIEFDLIDGKKNGNYIGSIDENMNVFMDDVIGDYVELLPSTNEIHIRYDNYFKKDVEESENIDNQQRIELLKQLSNLSEEEDYQSSKTK